MHDEPLDFPVLPDPPIVEVACGVHFKPMGLDGMVLGVFWDRRRTEYPGQSLQPAFAEGPGFVLGNPPLRGVLMSADKVRVLQVQHDRFFMNWRAVGKTYPRFSRKAGANSLMVQCIDEYQKLVEFCQERFGSAPTPNRVELAKIDILERGRHWKDLDDLEKVLKIMGTFGQVHHSDNREIALRFAEHDPPHSLSVAVNSIADKPGGTLKAVRLEARSLVPTTGDLEAAFVEANKSVNGAFFKLLAGDQLYRFGLTGGAT